MKKRIAAVWLLLLLVVMCLPALADTATYSIFDVEIPFENIVDCQRYTNGNWQVASSFKYPYVDTAQDSRFYIYNLDGLSDVKTDPQKYYYKFYKIDSDSVGDSDSDRVGLKIYRSGDPNFSYTISENGYVLNYGAGCLVYIGRNHNLGYFVSFQNKEYHMHGTQCDQTNYSYPAEAPNVYCAKCGCGEVYKIQERSSSSSSSSSGLSGISIDKLKALPMAQGLVDINHTHQYDENGKCPCGISNGQHYHCVCGATHTRIGDHTVGNRREWTPLTQNNVQDGTLSLVEGSYYLDGDIEVSSTVSISADVNLCLNGHVLKKTGSGWVISIRNGKTLNLTDCTATSHSGYIDATDGLWKAGTSSETDDIDCDLTGGIITGGNTSSGNGAGVYVPLGTFNMYNGNIAGNNASGNNANGGGVYVAYDSDGRKNYARLYGGSITGNKAYTNGGGMFVGSQQVYIYGGEIAYNTAKNGGGIFNNQGSITMSGGSIVNNTSNGTAGGVNNSNSGASFTMSGGSISGNSAALYGGGVSVGSNTIVTVSGGSITGNRAGDTGGGGVYLWGTFNVSGAPVIQNNTYNGSENNVYIGNNQIGVGRLNSGASIGVKKTNGGVFTDGGSAYEQYFSSDDTSYGVRADGNNLKLAKLYAVTFKNADGTQLQSGNVAAGDTPVYTGATPTKAEDDQYTYTFDCWTPEIKAVAGNMTYTATYTKTAKTYNVTLDAHGGKINSGEVESYTCGTVVPLPLDVTRPGYAFGGWYDNEACTGTAVAEIDADATGHKTYFAKWLKYNSLTVGNGEKETKEFIYGETIYVCVSYADANEGVMTLALDAPVTGQMVLLYNGQQISEPANPVNGTYTLTYNTTGKLLPIGEKLTLKVRCISDSEIYEIPVEVLIMPRELNITVKAENRMYNPELYTVKVTEVLYDVVAQDEVFVKGVDHGVLSDNTVDEYSSIILPETAKLAGGDAGFYALPKTAAVSPAVAITPVEVEELIHKTELALDFTEIFIPENMPKEADTVEEIEAVMMAKLLKAGLVEPNTVLCDATLYYSEDGGKTWIKATADHFPANGRLTVKMPVPEGTHPDKHDYTVVHMFTTDAFANKKAGEMEMPDVTIVYDEKGKPMLSFEVTGLSPIMIAWTEKASAEDLPQTGDHSQLMLWLCLMSMAGAGMYLLGKRACSLMK